ncbi:phytanoyl-CoA dioxygenase [Anabaena sphaerica FACHB-251]|uniref:Phytanoyl-CoA dioxygenase n=1 Tax=Anabaena sphaerica FACHB-251 TaxID=2692883 RepID=A0A926WDH2_9NOST|nr:phytanoyl-CoA dioxygenase [Anabaena sphaerica]MBD2292509.1 phytanoyl-CoA dioxygenase [Anabaena sphaerica FACHB-251]
MIQTLKNKINMLTSELDYRVALAKHKKKLPVLSHADNLIAQALKREGVYVTSLEHLGLPSTAQMLDSANSYAAMMESPRNIQSGYKLPQIYTVTDLPEFFTWGIEKRLQNIIENYIRLPMVFHGVHVRKDFPNEQQLQTLLWHKDSEDRRMIKVIIYLNDVTEKHGPFEYLPLPTNLVDWCNYYRVDYALWKSNYLGINDEKMMKIIPKSAWKSCPGKIGTVIFVDPRNVLHHGTVRTEERSTLFFVYTANPPKRPELCTQYNDDTFIKPNKQLIPESIGKG